MKCLMKIITELCYIAVCSKAHDRWVLQLQDCIQLYSAYATGEFILRGDWFHWADKYNCSPTLIKVLQFANVIRLQEATTATSVTRSVLVYRIVNQRSLKMCGKCTVVTQEWQLYLVYYLSVCYVRCQLYKTRFHFLKWRTFQLIFTYLRIQQMNYYLMK